jgi:cob(I)alamin adenosyltransferase
MSIATKTGDTGHTALAGGTRISKASLRVETYGNVDELNANLGLARALCDDEDIRARAKHIQGELFLVGSALSAPPQLPGTDSKDPKAPVTSAMVEALTTQVHELESIEGMLSDWSIPGEHIAAAAFDVARTVCRRAERSVVTLHETGEAVDANVIAYLNRLSDLLWLFGRKLERDAGKDASLRKLSGKTGPNFSRAW